MFQESQDKEYFSLCVHRAKKTYLVWVEQFLDIISENADMNTTLKLNDIGCNLGQFWKGLKRRDFVNIDYNGFDYEEMYVEEGIITPNVLADENGNPETQLDRNLREIIKACGWKDIFDEDGRKYTSYAIRKWHINTSIEAGDDPHDVALRCGHDYETLVRWYLDKTRRNKPVKANIWQRRKKLKSA